ncbi:MAG: hypothetical protein M3Z54_07000 [Gemmatimonadota bacterium]|nr:hypothetical protein [Gemmatimonadota bacterium]
MKLTLTDIAGGSSLATTVYSKDPNSLPMAPPNVVTDSHLRYTFSALRTWPCADAPSIATTAANSFDWSVPGEYSSFSVHVIALASPLPRALPSVIGDGSTRISSIVRPTGPSRTITWDVWPPTGSHGPTKVLITSTVPSTPELSRFRIRITCGPGCQPSEGTKEWTYPLHPFGSSSLLTTVDPGWPHFTATVDEVRTGTPQAPDCTWVASWSASQFDYHIVPSS